MEQACQVILAMFEAHRSKLKIDLSRKANIEDLQALAAKLDNPEQFKNIELRVSTLEKQIKVLDFDNVAEEEEDEDDIDSHFLEDIEVSVEKERRRNKDSRDTERSKQNELGSRESLQESIGSNLQRPLAFRSRGTLGSGGTNKHMLMMGRDLSAANDKIGKLTLDFEELSAQLVKMRSDQKKLQTHFNDMLTYSEKLKKEAVLMGQQNEKFQHVLQEANAKTKLIKEDVGALIEEVRAENGKLTHRLVNLETEHGTIKHEGLSFRKKLQFKFDESIELISNVKGKSGRLFKELKDLKAYVKLLEADTQREIGGVKEELGHLMGPAKEYMEMKGRESETLNEEVRRHQGLFRKLAEEYISMLDISMKSHDSPQRSFVPPEEILRLKQENAHLRASTTSPFSKLHLPDVASPLRFSKLNFDFERLKTSSLRSPSRPYSRVTPLITSRETPRQLNISVKR
jgi:hypothetical protein